MSRALSELEGFLTWENLLYSPRDRKRIDNVAEVLRRHLPTISEGAARILAGSLIAAPSSSVYLRTTPEDSDALVRLERALATVVESFEALSPHTRGALWTAAQDVLGHADAAYLLGGSIAMARRRGALLARARAILEQSPDRRTNLAVVVLLDAAVEIWCAAGRPPPPQKRLNPATPFGFYISDVLAEVGVGGETESAFRAWRKWTGRVQI